MLTITIPSDESPRSKYHTFHCSDRFAQAIAQLRACKLGFATVHGYRPTTNWVVPPVQNINFNFGFVVSRFYKAQKEAIATLSLADLDLSKWVPNKNKNAFATAEEQFDYCRDALVGSKEKSLAGELANAHSEAHSRNYCGIRNSIKVNFITEKDENGLEIPVLDANGIPTVASILVPYLERHTTTVVEGERKVVNSGSKILMDNAIEHSLPKSLQFRMLSLKDDNFDKLVMSSDVIESEVLHS